MNVSNKFRWRVIGGAVVPLLGIGIFTFLIGPRLVGKQRAVHIGSTLGLWFIVYLMIVVAVVIAREIKAKRPK